MKYIKYYDFLADDQNKGQFEKEDIAFFSEHNLFLYFSVFTDINPIDLQASDEHKKYILTHKLLYKKRVAELCTICKALDSEGIQYLVIKGIILAETYPEPFTRVMGDHDILVHYNDFNRAQIVLQKIGYANPDNKATYKDVTLSKQNCLKIELHHALFNKDLDTFAGIFEENIWDNLDSLIIGKDRISVLSTEIHFRYIILHMMKHLNAMGAGLRHLLDIKYFSNYHNIDLLEQYSFFESIGYGRYYNYCISLCVHYLGTHIDDAQDFLISKDDPVLNAFGDYIAENGVFGCANEKHRINMRYEKYKKRSGNNSALSIFKHAIFPNQSEISFIYTYAKKNPNLLPIAWIHRLLNKVFRKDLRTKEKLFFFTHDDNDLDSINLLKKQLGINEDRK